MGERQKKDDCLVGAAHIGTNGDNDLGKMVEYKTMELKGFKPELGRRGVPKGFTNSHTSGLSTWLANPQKQAEATQLAVELIARFEASKIALSLACKGKK